MQPTFAQPQAVIPNNISAALRAKRDKWADELDIKDDEMLVFRALSTGNKAPLRIKRTVTGHENMDAELMKPLPQSFSIPMHETIVDRDAPGGFVQLIHYDGGYFPGKQPTPVTLKGFDETTITVVPQENPVLYDFLTLTPRLVGGITSTTRVATKIELLRPLRDVENDLDYDRNQAAVILAIYDANYETLKFLAPQLNLPSETASQARMQKNFVDYAKLQRGHVTQVQQLFDADETLMYEQVGEAVAANVIAVNREKGVWVFTSTQEAITPANVERNNLDQLVRFLMVEEGQPTYQQIIALLGDTQLAAPAPKRRGGRPPKVS